ncbi:hypothetical protein L6R29_13965 [Myxococcota bacterium]|nr:hypothetical protein [Myxococcota bacterium]
MRTRSPFRSPMVRFPVFSLWLFPLWLGCQTPSVCKDPSCASTANCKPEEGRCGSSCVLLQTDPKHCGACGKTCPSNHVCKQGACVLECPKDQAVCGSSCVSLQKDPKHCGACGVGCPSDHVCVDGSCAFQCPQGTQDCGNNVCISVQTDPKNCGACGKVCLSDCKEGRCAPVRDLALGAGHSCILLEDQTAQCWGKNDAGQLGHSATSPTDPPQAVVGLTKAKQLAVGSKHSCALFEDGSVGCWGLDAFGTGSTTTTPKKIQGISRATQITAGDAHNCALLEDGTGVCWGWGMAGQLGTGSTPMFGAVAPILGLSRIKQLSAGSTHTCARLEDGTVKCWGNNNNGQLGNGTAGNTSPNPLLVIEVSGAQDISAGHSSTCAILKDGTAKCWGSDLSGNLGVGDRPGWSFQEPTPLPVQEFRNGIQISAGTSHTCATSNDGTAFCWGNNNDGQLGGSKPDSTRTALQVQGLTGIQRVAVGNGISCAIFKDSTHRCWGQRGF